MQSTMVSTNLSEIIFQQIEKVRSANPDFQEAYDNYVQQYGRDKVSVSEPVDLSGSVDPIVLVLGRNCVVSYYDSTKELRGSLGSQRIDRESVYLIGRREPQDSKLISWDPMGNPTELEMYNPRADTIPSRVHGALCYLGDGQVLYSDLGSSAGSVLIGQSSHKGGGFVRIYDPGSEKTPSVQYERVFTSRRTS
jgi:hypothetical protein